jgi:very-short-patch-repair endonuclease
MLRIMRKVPNESVVPNLRIPAKIGSYYIDFAFPQHMVGVETHGLRWHFGEEKWKEDLKRDRALTLMGWTMLYFSRDDVCWAPDEVRGETCSILNQAAMLRGTRLPGT